MTKSMKILVAAVLSFSFIFATFGYAAVSDILRLSGKATIEIPYGLFITEIKSSTSDLDKNDVDFLDYSTSVDSTLSKTKYNVTGKVTYTITVFNNTEYKYSYRKVYYQSGLYYNNSIGTANNSKIKIETNFPDGKIVNPGDSLTFTATYTISAGTRQNQDQNIDYRTLVNFQFGINVDRLDQATKVVHEKFLNILNTNSTYLQLLDALDNKFDGSQEWTSNYIGNVTNASNEDSALVNQLFAGHLQITVGKDEYPATVLIKHENLDGLYITGDDYTATNTNNGGTITRTGCEMTLYLTVDPLDAAGEYVPVYASVFTCDRDANGNKTSDWYEIGSMYLGTADVVTYDGQWGTGSFVTDHWLAEAATYTPIEGYTYSVASGATIKNLVSIVDPNAITAFQQLLNRAVAVIENPNYAGTGIVAVENAYYEASQFYTLDASGKPVANSNTTRARLIPIMINLEHSVKVAEEEIKNLEGKN